LRQELPFVSDDIAAQTEPTDTDLNAYLQVHLDPEKHGNDLVCDTAHAVGAVEAG
jgi:hypothetical protein